MEIVLVLYFEPTHSAPVCIGGCWSLKVKIRSRKAVATLHFEEVVFA